MSKDFLAWKCKNEKLNFFNYFRFCQEKNVNCDLKKVKNDEQNLCSMKTKTGTQQEVQSSELKWCVSTLLLKGFIIRLKHDFEVAKQAM